MLTFPEKDTFNFGISLKANLLGCNENELGTIRTIHKRWEEDPTCEESVAISFSDAD